PALAELLGLENQGFLREEYPGQFACMRFQKDALPGLPREAKQASWNIQRVRPAARGARTLATWVDKQGKDTGYPAVVLSDVGVYFSHVVLHDDPANKDRMLRALLGALYPPLWEEVARHAVETAGSVSGWRAFDQAEAGIRAAAAASGRTATVAGLLRRARDAYQRAALHLREGRHAAVLEPAGEARSLLLNAYARAQSARGGEFRGVWVHSAYGVTGMTWDQAIRRLKESGFNAVVPNMLWGGVADYPSAVLPVRDRVAREGDQIAACLAACRKYGVELHVWKVNWNLSGAPNEFVERLRAEGRLQQNNRGEEVAWLCPSNPANFELEKASMLEVARNYDVDGIHFDYIRYPGQESCYCNPCRARFEASAGVKVGNWPADVLRGGPLFAEYQEFRRGNITRLVKAVSEEAHRIKPWLKVSAAVFSNWPGCRETVGQDWGQWVAQGYLDFVCPMDYTDSNASFRTQVQVQRDEVAGRIPLYPGIGASAPGLPLDQVIDQIRIARQEGADGFILFQYAGEPAATYVPTLGEAMTAGTTTPPHNAPRVEWRLMQGGESIAGRAKAEAPLHVEAVVTTRGALRVAARRVSATVVLTTADGTLVQELGRTSARSNTVTGEVKLTPGLYRPVARGEMEGTDGRRRPFVARGPFVRVGD
ncbi:MAG: family 10 glycosylhydrolase, partial [Armatimonadota bacterium]|nr:family 10 glycosylhydrolase [Armatimonadota bacterium]